MAGAGWKDFVPGEVLSAANVQDYLQDQSVMVFASAAARTSALASPSEGMVSYLKDTDTVERFDGSSWVVPFSVANGGTGATTVADAQDSLRVGLVPISPASVQNAGGTATASTLGDVFFDNTSSVSLNGVFTTKYRRYLITYNYIVSGAGEFRYRFRASGTDNAANYNQAGWRAYIGGGSSAYSGVNMQQGALGDGAPGGPQMSGRLEIIYPAAAVYTTTQAHHHGSTSGAGISMTVTNVSHEVAAAYDGITIFPGLGAMQGNIQVFAYLD